MSGWYSRSAIESVVIFSVQSLPASWSRDDLLHGVDDLDPAAVVERDRERHARVVARELLGGLDLLQHRARNAPVAPAR